MMGGGFWFFTDADRLAVQSQAEAFGPVAGNEATQFRVTDLHTAAAASTADADQPRAYAICDGLLRARLDDEGGLTLILKPSQQPPFDFPPVAFFLYKGVRPDSLLKGAAPWPLVDPARANQSPLVARIVQDWQANGNVGEPSSKSLGLHLDSATPASDGFDPTLYGDLQPLDNLFYHGDGLFPPRLVSAGEVIGFFAATRFGLEVAIDRIGAPPLIRLATKRETIVTARAMPTGTLAPDHADAFMSRHERDAILGFVDPCAFWGSFLLSGISAHGTSLSDTNVPRASIYAELLTGPNAAAPKFENRHKAYIDIRNDHGHSLNYYRETGDEVRHAIDPAATSLLPASYYADNGWPSFAAPLGLPPSATAATDVLAPYRIALPAAAGSQPIAYVSAGYAVKGKALAPRTGAERFVTGPLQTGGFSATILLTLPLALPSIAPLPNTAPKIHASYHRLHQFRRGGVGLSATPPAHSVAPFFQAGGDHLFPIAGKTALPRQIAQTAIRAYGDLYYIPGTGGAGGCIARPGVARDTNNFYLFLLPVVLAQSGGADLFRPAFPAFEERSEFQFRPDLLLESGPRLTTRDIQATAGGGTITVTLAREQAPPAANADLSDNFQVIAMDETEYDAAVLASAAAVPGTVTVSLGTATVIADHEEFPSTLSYVKPAASPTSPVTREQSAGLETLYRDASV